MEVASIANATTTGLAPPALRPRRARSARRGRRSGHRANRAPVQIRPCARGCWTAPGFDACVRRTGSSPGSPTPAGLASTRTGSPGGGENAPAPSDGRGWCARTGSAGWMAGGLSDVRSRARSWDGVPRSPSGEFQHRRGRALRIPKGLSHPAPQQNHGLSEGSERPAWSPNPSKPRSSAGCSRSSSSDGEPSGTPPPI